MIDEQGSWTQKAIRESQMLLDSYFRNVMNYILLSFETGAKLYQGGSQGCLPLLGSM